MTLLEHTCVSRDVPFPLELAADLTVQSLLVPFEGQEEVGPLLLELPVNGFWVWRATPSEKASPTAWINTPAGSSSPSSCRSTARLWFAPVA